MPILINSCNRTPELNCRFIILSICCKAKGFIVFFFVDCFKVNLLVLEFGQFLLFAEQQNCWSANIGVFSNLFYFKKWINKLKFYSISFLKFYELFTKIQLKNFI